VHRIRASLIAAVLVVVPLAWLEPAAAGGPTSALLSVPGQGKTASLYYTDPEYDALADLVGVTGDTGTVDSSGRSHDGGGPGVTITWMIHDVDPWRIDRVYPAQNGGPWIATQTVGESGTLWDSPVTWHRPEDGKALMTLLDDLGLGQAASGATDFGGVAGAPVPAQAEDSTTEPVSADQPTAGASGDQGLGWALGGLVVGVLVALLGTRLRTRRQRDPDPVPVVEPDAGLRDELAWPTPRR
jgi:hypothetical protein